ncbi:tetratricopeptide repeat protein [Spirosoma pomorum]
MIYLFIAAWSWLTNPLLSNQISRNNQARQQAQKAYDAGNYQEALTLYTSLTRTTALDPAVRLNMGHTYFQLRQYQKARPQYEALLRSDKTALRSVATTQLGVIACMQEDSATALILFQQALLEDANNESARYNFELIKKTFSGKAPAGKLRQQQVSRQKQQASPNQSMSQQQVERSDEQDELLRRFQRLNLSEAQALQLLDAMQNDDLPYALTRSARPTTTKAAAGGNRW